MHGVNLDLLRAASAHHPDGRPKDAYAHHRAEHLAALAEARATRHQALLARLKRLFRLAPVRQAKAPTPCP